MRRASSTLLYFLFICVFVFLLSVPQTEKKTNMTENNLISSIKENNDGFKILQDNLQLRLQTRVKQLETKSLQDWIDYNNKENLIKIDNKPFYFFIFKSISKKENMFKVLAHHKKKFINMTWSDIFYQQQNNFLFVKEKTNENLIEHMYLLSKEKKDGTIVFRYHWTDPIENELILKEAVIKFWEKDGETGIIGSGYNIISLSDSIKISYKNYTYIISSFIYLFITAFISILLSKRNILLSLTFFVVSLFCYLLYENSVEFIGSNETEKQKRQSIDSMVLSLSFLIGVNIFILKSFKEAYTFDQFREISIIFACSIILILFTIINFASAGNIEELMSYRISKQLIFNLAVLLNILIIFSYFLHSNFHLHIKTNQNPN